MRYSGKITYDICIVGSGPAGAIVAKKCAEYGLNSIILEKKRIPRDKVCSGIIMGQWAHDIIKREFGDIPKDLLEYPYYLTGFRLHGSSANPVDIPFPMAISWRKNLDTWMTYKAVAAGAKILDGCRVISVIPGDQYCLVNYLKDGYQRELRASYVIGSDGARSVVRKGMQPELKAKYTTAYREIYRQGIPNTGAIWHWLITMPHFRPRVSIHEKGGLLIIDGGVKAMRGELQGFLRSLNIRPDREPIIRDGCITVWLYEELLGGTFRPAGRRIILVGDAAGLTLPVTREGIGSALKSGYLAAMALSESFEHACEAYLEKVKEILALISWLIRKERELKKKSLEAPKDDALMEFSKLWKKAMGLEG